MTSSALTLGRASGTTTTGAWIRSVRWDLTFISASVLLVPVPYLLWILMSNVWQVPADTARQVVNLLIAGLIGGPHMYATFTRTALDSSFRGRHHTYVRSALVIPVIVVVLAVSNLTVLLTAFFLWASLHVLNQILYIVEAYNTKARAVDKAFSLSLGSRIVDYAVVLTALYPIAAYRIAITQDFSIGPNKLNDAIPGWFEQPWIVYVAGIAFGISLIAFIVKTIYEFRAGTAHVPKVLFIAFTVIASFVVPSLGNLDTAFQGMNVWHSFQYLALTWYVNRLREERGELQKEPLLERLSKDGAAKIFYLFNFSLTVGTLLVIGLAYLILHGIGGQWAEASFALETSYYIGVLSFLWVHYYFDHYLFTQTKAVLP